MTTFSFYTPSTSAGAEEKIEERRSAAAPEEGADAQQSHREDVFLCHEEGRAAEGGDGAIREEEDGDEVAGDGKLSSPAPDGVTSAASQSDNRTSQSLNREVREDETANNDEDDKVAKEGVIPAAGTAIERGNPTPIFSFYTPSPGASAASQDGNHTVLVRNPISVFSFYSTSAGAEEEIEVEQRSTAASEGDAEAQQSHQQELTVGASSVPCRGEGAVEGDGEIQQEEDDDVSPAPDPQGHNHTILKSNPEVWDEENVANNDEHDEAAKEREIPPAGAVTEGGNPMPIFSFYTPSTCYSCEVWEREHVTNKEDEDGVAKEREIPAAGAAILGREAASNLDGKFVIKDGGEEHRPKAEGVEAYERCANDAFDTRAEEEGENQAAHITPTNSHSGEIVQVAQSNRHVSEDEASKYIVAATSNITLPSFFDCEGAPPFACSPITPSIESDSSDASAAYATPQRHEHMMPDRTSAIETVRNLLGIEAEYTSKMAALERDVASRDGEIGTLAKQVDELKLKNADYALEIKHMDELKLKNADYALEISRLSKTITELIDSNAEQEEALLSSFDELAGQNTALQNQVEDLIATNKKLEKGIHKSDAKNFVEVISQNTALQNRVDDLIATNKKLEKSIHESTAKDAELVETLDGLTTGRNATKRCCPAEVHENDDRELGDDDTEEKGKGMKARMTEENEAKNRGLGERLESEKQTVKTLMEEMEGLRKRVSDEEVVRAELENEKTLLEDRIEILEDTNEKLKLDRDKMKAYETQTVKFLKEEMEGLRKRMSDEQVARAELEHEKARLKDSIEVLEDANEKLKLDRDEVKAENEAKNSDFEQRLESETQTAMILKEQIEGMRTRMIDEQVARAELVNEKTRLEDSIELLEDANEKLKLDIDELKAYDAKTAENRKLMVKKMAEEHRVTMVKMNEEFKAAEEEHWAARAKLVMDLEAEADANTELAEEIDALGKKLGAEQKAHVDLKYELESIKISHKKDIELLVDANKKLELDRAEMKASAVKLAENHMSVVEKMVEEHMFTVEKMNEDYTASAEEHKAAMVKLAKNLEAEAKATIKLTEEIDDLAKKLGDEQKAHEDLKYELDSTNKAHRENIQLLEDANEKLKLDRDEMEASAVKTAENHKFIVETMAQEHRVLVAKMNEESEAAAEEHRAAMMKLTKELEAEVDANTQLAIEIHDLGDELTDKQKAHVHVKSELDLTNRAHKKYAHLLEEANEKLKLDRDEMKASAAMMVENHKYMVEKMADEHRATVVKMNKEFKAAAEEHETAVAKLAKGLEAEAEVNTKLTQEIDDLGKKLGDERKAHGDLRSELDSTNKAHKKYAHLLEDSNEKLRLNRDEMKASAVKMAENHKFMVEKMEQEHRIMVVKMNEEYKATAEEHKTALANLVEDLEAEADVNTQLTNAIDDLGKKLGDEQKAHAHFKSELESTNRAHKKQVQLLEDANEKLKLDRDDVKALAVKTAESHKSMVEKMAQEHRVTLEKMNEESRTAAEEQKAAMAKLAKDLEAEADANTQITKELDSLGKKLRAQQKVHEHLKSELDSNNKAHKEDIQLLEDENEKLKLDRDKVKASAVKTAENHKLMIKKMADEHRVMVVKMDEDFKATAEEHEAAMTKLVKQLEAEAEEKNQLAAEIDDLGKKLEDEQNAHQNLKSNLDSTIKAHKEDVQMLEDANQKLKFDRDEMKAYDMKMAENHKSMVEKMAEEHRVTVVRMNEELKAAAEEHDSAMAKMKKYIEAGANANTQLAEEIGDLSKKLEDQQKAHETLKSELDSTNKAHKKDVQLLQDTNGKLKIDRDKMKDSGLKMQENHKFMVEKMAEEHRVMVVKMNGEFKAAVGEHKAAMVKLLKDLEAEADVNTQYAKEIDDLGKKLEDKQKAYEDLICELDSTNKAHKKYAHFLEDANEKLRQDKEEMKASAVKMAKNHESMVEKMAQEHSVIVVKMNEEFQSAVEEHKAAMVKLVKDLEAETDTNTRLNKKIENLGKKLGYEQKVHEDLKSELDSTNEAHNKNIQFLDDVNKKLKLDRDEMKAAAVKTAENHKAIVEKMAQEHRVTVVRMNEERKAVTEGLKAAMAKLVKDLEAEADTNTQLNEKIGDLCKKLGEEQTAHENLKSELESTNKAHKKDVQFRDDVNKKLKHDRDEMKAATVKTAENHKAIVETMAQEHRAMVMKMNEEFKADTEELKVAMAKLVKDLEAEADANTQLNEEIGDLTKKLGDEQNAHEDLKSELDSTNKAHKKEVQLLDDANEKLKLARDEVKATAVKSAENHKARVKKMAEEHSVTVVKMNDELKAATEEHRAAMAKLVKDLEAEGNANTELNEEIDDLSKKLRDEQKAHEDLKFELDSTNKAHKKDIQLLEDANENLKLDRDAMVASAVKTAGNHKSMMENIAEEHRVTVVKMNDEFKSAAEEHKAAVAKLINDVQTQADANTQLAKEVDSLSKKLAGEQNAHVHLKSELDSTNKAHKKGVKLLDDANEKLRHDRDEMKAFNVKMTENHKSAMEKMAEEHRVTVEGMNQKFKAAAEEHKAALAKLAKDLEAEADTNIQLAEEIDDLGKKLGDEQKAHAQLKSELDSTNKGRNNDIQLLKDANEKLKLAGNEMKANMVENRKSMVGKMNQEQRSLVAKMDEEFKAAAEEHKAAMGKLVKDLEAETDANTELAGEINDLEKKLGDEQKAHANLKAELDANKKAHKKEKNRLTDGLNAFSKTVDKLDKKASSLKNLLDQSKALCKLEMEKNVRLIKELEDIKQVGAKTAEVSACAITSTEKNLVDVKKSLEVMTNTHNAEINKNTNLMKELANAKQKSVDQASAIATLEKCIEGEIATTRELKQSLEEMKKKYHMECKQNKKLKLEKEELMVASAKVVDEHDVKVDKITAEHEAMLEKIGEDITASNAEYEAAVSTLKKEHQVIRQEHRATVEKMKEDHQAVIDAAEEDHKAAIKELSVEHMAFLAGMKSNNEAVMLQMRDDNKVTIADWASRLESKSQSVAQLERDVEGLRNALKEQQNATSAKLESTKTSYKKERARHLKQLEDAAKMVAELELTKKSYKKERARLTKQLEDAAKMVTMLQKKLLDVKTQLEETCKQLEDERAVTFQLKEVKQRLYETEQCLSYMTTQKENVSEKLREMKDRKTTSKTEHADCKASQADLLKRVKKLLKHLDVKDQTISKQKILEIVESTNED